MFTATTMQEALTIAPVVERLEQDFYSTSVVTRERDGTLQHSNYGELARLAKQLASALVRAGLRPGDRVATLMSNHRIHLAAMLGIPLCGGVFHALNPRLPAADLAYVIEDAEDRFLLVDATSLEDFARVREQVSIERVIVVGGDADEFAEFLASGTSTYSPPALDETSPLGLCYTSGTTGRPKGVVCSHRATLLHSMAVGMTDGFGMARKDVVLSVVPFFHTHAVGFPYAAALLGAAQVLAASPLAPEELLDLIVGQAVSFTGGLATGWAVMLDTLERFPGRWTLPAGLQVIAGGNALPASMIPRFGALNIEVVHTWGMTETGPLATSCRPQSESTTAKGLHEVEVARQGRVVPMLRARIASEDGKELPHDDQSLGELQVRGPWVTGSYLPGARSRERDASEGFTADGWLRTGDLAVMDANGSVRVVDRLKDIIRVGEEWVSSTAIEEAISQSPRVREVAVVSAPQIEHGEIPLAVVVCEGEPRPSAAELRQLIPPELLPAAVPVPVVFVTELPRAPTGKVSKKQLRELHGNLA